MPWLALLFFRAFFFRAFFAMLCLLVLVTVRPRTSAAEVAYGPRVTPGADPDDASAADRARDGVGRVGAPVVRDST